MMHGPKEDFYVHLREVEPRVWMILQGFFPVADGDMVDRALAAGKTVAEVFAATDDALVRERIRKALYVRGVVPWDTKIRREEGIESYEAAWLAACLAEVLKRTTRIPWCARCCAARLDSIAISTCPSSLGRPTSLMPHTSC